MFYLVEAIKCYNDAATAHEVAGDKRALAKSLQYIGYWQVTQGKYKEALATILQTLSVFEEIKDTVNLAYAYTQVGNVYYYRDEIDQALENYLKAYELNKTSGNELGTLQNLGNIGLFLTQIGKNEIALGYIEEALALSKELGNEKEIADNQLSMGVVHFNMGNLQQTVEYNLKALKYYEIHDGSAAGICYMNLGEAYAALGNYQKAVNYGKQAVATMEEFDNLYHLKDAHGYIADTYAKMGEYRKAYESHIMYRSLKDSILNGESNSAIAEMQTRYDSEKKEKENEGLRKAGRIKDLELTQQEDSIKQQRFFIGSSAVGVLFLLGLAFAQFRTRRVKHRTNEQLATQRDEITEQKQDITDSITYARDIQRASLPVEENMHKAFDECFVLYRPRDIVSGDFYWFNHFGDATVLAVADCTGHGVPGGFMSMMGSELLTQVISDPDVRDPGDALQRIDKRIIETLNKEGGKTMSNDGMDMCICTFLPEQKILQFAGANRPVIRIRDGAMNVFPFNKKGVGGRHKQTGYDHTELPYEKGDCYYMFTDGFPDQFGGPKNKKFMRKRLQDLILDIAEKPMEEQKQELETTFDDWRGSERQVDDVCLIGVRV